MLLQAFRRRAKGKSEAEKPFWISYADLMTAMMVLCLVTMAVTILVTQKAKNEASAEAKERAEAIGSICDSLEEKLATLGESGISIDDCDSDRNRIDFGERGRFALASDRLPDGAAPAIAAFLPQVLSVAKSDEGIRWMRRVVVEGYTDTKGGYLYNLNLSLRRSERVMCLLMDQRANPALTLSNTEIAEVQQLFVAGGVSFADQMETAEESRRVEMRLEFYPPGDRDPITTRAQFSAAPDRCRI